MKIYVGFAGPNGGFVPLAWIIQAVLKRKYDHVYIRFQEPEGEWMIFQASGFAVNMYNTGIWKGGNTSIKEYEIDITSEQWFALWNFVKYNLGVPYSLKEDFGILLMKCFWLKKNPFDAGMSAEICSQLGANVCKMLGLPIPEDSSSIDPSKLDSILSQKSLPCNNNPNF
jgi:hypothetical protein